MNLLADPWRAVCPRGHRAWERRSDGYRCETCSRNGQDDRFERLHDAKDMTSDPHEILGVPEAAPRVMIEFAAWEKKYKYQVVDPERYEQIVEAEQAMLEARDE